MFVPCFLTRKILQFVGMLQAVGVVGYKRKSSARVYAVEKAVVKVL